MAKILYTLKESEDTSEFHLFRATPRIDNNCTPESKSICGKMVKEDSKKNIFPCMDEDSARLRSAKTGRNVCGTCISHLYGSF